jgi:hypothetical protein
MTLPPWLEITPSSYLNAMEAGSRTGLQERQIGDSEREDFQRNALEQQQLQAQEQARQVALSQRQQQAEEFSAGQSLQRDKLVADTALTAQQQQQMAQQQSAADALRQAQLQQAGLLGQGRLDAENTRNENEDEFHQGELDNQSAANDLRASAQATSSTPSDKMKLEELRGLNHKRDVALSKGGVETAAKIDAQIQQLLNPPTPAVQPTPAADALKQKYHDAVQSGNQTAAAAATSDLRALLASQPPTSALPPSVAPQGYASPPGGGAMVPLPDAAAGLSQSPASKDPLLQDNTLKPAVGGYKVGKKYKGMTYLGGDPNDENNWQR